jgi:hypothetical protein
VTDPTLSAIQGVAQDVRDLRAEITGRLGDMITRREHVAEVKRLDAEDTRTREALAEHERQADLRLTAIQVAVDRGDTEIRALIEAAEERRQAAVEAAAERRRQDRRWFATWAVAAVGAAVAVTQVIAALLR